LEDLAWFMITNLTKSPKESVVVAVVAAFAAYSHSGRKSSVVVESSMVPQPPSTSALDKMIDRVKVTSDSVSEKLLSLRRSYSAEAINQYEASQAFIKQTIDSSINCLQLPCAWVRAPSSKSYHASSMLTKRDSLAHQRKLRYLFLQCVSASGRNIDCVRKLFEVGISGAVPSYASTSCRWRELLRKTTDTMDYIAWCIPLRKGLNVYKTRTIFHGVTANEYLDFMMDDAFRLKWDGSLAAWEGKHEVSSMYDSSSGSLSQSAVLSEESAQKSADVNISDIYCRVRVPMPFASRQYFLQRSMWRSANGGQIICSARPHQNAAASPCKRSITVYDYISCCSARTIVDKRTGRCSTEVVYMYFEDPRLPPSIVNNVVRIKLVPGVLKLEGAMRSHVKQKGQLGRNGRWRAREAVALDQNRGRVVRGVVRRVFSIVTLACLVGTNWQQ